jgi:hypothetical protein
LPNARTFSAATRAWYRVWTRSPQSEHFTATEWQRLAMLAHLIDRFYSDPDPKLLTEIRMNEQLLGATPADRRRLGWDDRRPASVTQVVDDEAAKRRAARDAKLRLVEGA